MLQFYIPEVKEVVEVRREGGREGGREGEEGKEGGGNFCLC